MAGDLDTLSRALAKGELTRRQALLGALGAGIAGVWASQEASVLEIARAKAPAASRCLDCDLTTPSGNWSCHSCRGKRGALRRRLTISRSARASHAFMALRAHSVKTGFGSTSRSAVVYASKNHRDTDAVYMEMYGRRDGRRAWLISDPSGTAPVMVSVGKHRTESAVVSVVHRGRVVDTKRRFTDSASFARSAMMSQLVQPAAASDCLSDCKRTCTKVIVKGCEDFVAPAAAMAFCTKVLSRSPPKGAAAKLAPFMIAACGLAGATACVEKVDDQHASKICENEICPRLCTPPCKDGKVQCMREIFPVPSLGPRSTSPHCVKFPVDNCIPECRRLGTDDNCSNCDDKCDRAVGRRCIDGTCQCPSGLTYCPRDGTCSDLTSTRHCGKCDNMCKKGQVCRNKECKPASWYCTAPTQVPSGCNSDGAEGIERVYWDDRKECEDNGCAVYCEYTSNARKYPCAPA
jgi:hypothetical protein